MFKAGSLIHESRYKLILCSMFLVSSFFYLKNHTFLNETKLIKLKIDWKDLNQVFFLLSVQLVCIQQPN